MAALLGSSRDPKGNASRHAPLRVAAKRGTALGAESADGQRAAAAVRRLRAPGGVSSRVGWLVEHRLLAAGHGELDDAAFRRTAASGGWEELCALTRAEARATGRPSMGQYRGLRRRARQWRPGAMLPAPLLGGDDLKRMGHVPGPRFGPVLRALYDAQLNGQLHTRAQAAALARQLLGA
jgi:hypothetical protein